MAQAPLPTAAPKRQAMVSQNSRARTSEGKSAAPGWIAVRTGTVFRAIDRPESFAGQVRDPTQLADPDRESQPQLSSGNRVESQRDTMNTRRRSRPQGARLCPPRTTCSGRETSWAPGEIRRFPCGQPVAAGAPRTQPRSGKKSRGARGFCRVVVQGGGAAAAVERDRSPVAAATSEPRRLEFLALSQMRNRCGRGSPARRKPRGARGIGSATFTPLHRSNVVGGPTLLALLMRRVRAKAFGFRTPIHEIAASPTFQTE